MASMRSWIARCTSPSRAYSDCRPARRRYSAMRLAAFTASGSETFRHPPAHRCESLRQSLGIGAARLRHVGPAAALAAHLPRDMVHELARLHARDEIRGHARDEA